MSVPQKARKLRVKMSTSVSITSVTVADVVADGLKATWGHLRHAPKLLARKIDANERTAANLLEGRNAPSAATLVRLMAEDDEVFARILELANRQPPAALTEKQRQAVVDALRIMEGKSP